MTEEKFITEQNLVKFLIGTKLWLVPESLATDAFISAVEKLNNTELSKGIEWTDEERKAVVVVLGHYASWMLE